MDIWAQQPFHVGDWYVDPLLCQLVRNGSTVQMERRHLDVLLLLASRAGEIVEAKHIEDFVWRDVEVDRNSLHQVISQLRRALTDGDTDQQYIETVTRRGYRLVAPVTPVAVLPAAEPATQETAAPNPTPALAPSRRLQRWHLVAISVGCALLTGVLAFGYVAAQRAAKASDQAEQLSNFAVDVFSAAARHPQEEMVAGELVASAAQRATSNLTDPLRRAQMLQVIGRSYTHSSRGQEAVAVYEEALRLRRSLDSQPELAEALTDMAHAYRDSLRLGDAERTYREALQIWSATVGERSVECASLFGFLGQLEMLRGNAPGSIELLQRSIELTRATRGSRHTYVAEHLAVLADAYLSDRRLPEAERALREAISIYEVAQPELFPNRVNAHFRLAQLYRMQGRMPEAANELEYTLRAQRELYGAEGRTLGVTVVTLSNVYFALGRVKEAIELNTEAVGLFKRLGPAGDAERAYAHIGLGRWYLQSGELAKGEKLFREALTLSENAPSKDPLRISTVQYWIGEALLAQNKLAEAQAVLQASIDLLPPKPQWRVDRSLNALGEARLRQGSVREGRTLILQSHERLFTQQPTDLESQQAAAARLQRLSLQPTAKKVR